MKSNIEIITIDSIHTAGILCVGDQNLSSSFNRLLKWAGPKGLIDVPQMKMATIYYDSFRDTAADKVQMRACLLVENPIKTDGEVTPTTIKEGLHIVSHHDIGLHEFGKAWTDLFIWMNTNGYKIRKEPPFEIYHNDFNTHPEKKCSVDMYIPVE